MSAVVNNGPFYNAAPDIDEEEINLGDILLPISRTYKTDVATILKEVQGKRRTSPPKP